MTEENVETGNVTPEGTEEGTEENPAENVVENTPKQAPEANEKVPAEQVADQASEQTEEQPVTEQTSFEKSGEHDSNEMNVTEESNVIIEEVKEFYDPDEKILAELLESGKTQVTTNDLISLGFDTERMKPFSFQVGRYKLSRLVMISPYTLEKIE